MKGREYSRPVEINVARYYRERLASMKGREYSRPVTKGAKMMTDMGLASMKGREYSRPVTSWVPGSGRYIGGFNEGAGIFPPGDGGGSCRSTGNSRFNEGAGIFPPGVASGGNDNEPISRASMKGREYSRPVVNVNNS